MITTSKLVSFLEVEGATDAPIVRGPELPEMPTRLVVVTISGGAGLQMEAMFDTPTFQVRCRGAHNRYGDAEDIAADIDRFLLFKVSNMFVDDVWITHATRTGGAPALDVSGQVVCNYVMFASTGVESG